MPTTNTPLTEPSRDEFEPYERRRAFERLREHLDSVGDICSDECCRVCQDETVSKEVGRLRIARQEYNLKVRPLRRAVQDSVCVYCGDVPNDRDHLLPRWWTGESLRRHVPTVAACRSCNGILSDFSEPIIAARTDHIAARLRRRWGKQLARTTSLQGLTGTLRHQIAAANVRRGVIRGRVVVLELGGVPEIPVAWQDSLLLDGPGVLATGTPVPIAPSAASGSSRSPRWSAPTSREPRRAAAVTNRSALITPGGAYLARMEAAQR